jgi:HEAT repeat protein
MKPLSPRTAELLASLERTSNFSERLLGRAGHDRAVLAELGRHPEPAVVPHLLWFVFGGSGVVARAAAEALDSAVAAASALDLLQLDDACRRVDSDVLPWARGWAKLTPADVARFEGLGDAEVSVVGVASFHRSGYVRAAAVARLDTLAGGRELPFLLIRRNDWVDSVADRARAAVERRLGPQYAPALVDALPILLRLAVSTRREHGDLLDRVYALLRAPEQREALARGLEAPDRATRRASFRLAQESAGEELAAVLQRALRDPDPTIRLRGVADARRRLNEAELVALVAAALADPFPPVRREGLVAAAERLPGSVDGWLRTGLLDRSRVVREAARFYLRRLGSLTNFVDFYRERLQRGAPARELPIVVAGLGETGTRGDAELLVPYLTHDRAAARRDAVRALAALDLESQLPRLVEMLWDESPGVTHAVRDALAPQAGRIGSQPLARTFRTAPRVHSRLDALSLAAGLGKWESLPLLIEATADTDERVRAVARERLDAWMAKQNRNFAEPTPSQLGAILAALDAHAGTVDSRLIEELRLVLRFWAA